MCSELSRLYFSFKCVLYLNRNLIAVCVPSQCVSKPLDWLQWKVFIGVWIKGHLGKGSWSILLYVQNKIKKTFIYLFSHKNASLSNEHFSTAGLEVRRKDPWILKCVNELCFLVCDVQIKHLLFFFFTASLRSELNHIHASAIEHLRQTHQQESAAAKMELEKTLENNRTQVRPQRDRERTDSEPPHWSKPLW